MDELIDKYFEGTLSKDEEVLFNKEIQENISFKTEFDFQKKVRKALHLKERAALKSSLQNLESRQINSNLKVVKRTFWPYAAAAVLLIISAFGLYQYLNDSNSYQKLYAANFEAYPNVIAPSVRGERTATLETEAFKAYDANNYQDAALLFEKLEQKEYVQFYRAVCYLELDKMLEAVKLLENKTFKNVPYPFETYRKWYLALAYLKLDKTSKAKSLLQELSIFDNPQKETATKLLNDL